MGSSETTREPPSIKQVKKTKNKDVVTLNTKLKELLRNQKITFFDFDDFFTHHQPSQKKIRDEQFLQWFIGFIEGDGTFSSRVIQFNTKDQLKTKILLASLEEDIDINYLEDSDLQGSEVTFIQQNQEKKRRFVFEVCQKDVKIISFIKKKLGFGRIHSYKRDNSLYWKYCVEDKRGLQRIMSLFNGNLVLPKRKHQFENWVRKAQSLHFPGFTLKLTQPEVSLETGWLSGFIDAEGCFYAAFTTPSQRYKVSYRLTQKMHLTQKDVLGDSKILENIRILLESEGKVKLFQKDKNYYRVEFCSLRSHKLLVSYIEKFPLKVKKIVYRRWWRVYLLRLEKRHLNETGIKRMRRLAKAINESNFLVN